MKSQYQFIKNPGYITLLLSGQYSKEDFLLYPQLILERCEEQHVKKALVDASNLLGTDVPTMDRFFIAENLANFLRFKVKLAVVWPREHINRFAETVAVNRGTTIRVIDSIEGARKWLMED